MASSLIEEELNSSKARRSRRGRSRWSTSKGSGLPLVLKGTHRVVAVETQGLESCYVRGSPKRLPAPLPRAETGRASVLARAPRTAGRSIRHWCAWQGHCWENRRRPKPRPVEFFARSPLLHEASGIESTVSAASVITAGREGNCPRGRRSHRRRMKPIEGTTFAARTLSTVNPETFRKSVRTACASPADAWPAARPGRGAPVAARGQRPPLVWFLYVRAAGSMQPACPERPSV